MDLDAEGRALRRSRGTRVVRPRPCRLLRRFMSLDGDPLPRDQNAVRLILRHDLSVSSGQSKDRSYRRILEPGRSRETPSIPPEEFLLRGCDKVFEPVTTV